MPSHCRTLSLFPLIIFLILPLIFEILLIVTILAEIFLLEHEEAMTEITCLEINQPLRVKCKALISCFKMKMWTGRTSGRTTKANYITGIYPITFLNHSL